MSEFEKTVIGLVVLVLGFLITKAINNTSKAHDDIIVLQSKVSEIERNQENGFVQMERLFSERFQRFEDKVEHMDKTIQTNSQYFRVLAEEIKKK